MELFNPKNAPELSEIGKNLRNKIEDSSFIVGVAGLGYVGLPIALEYTKKGVKVIGVDVSKDKVSQLQKGENYIEDLKDEEIADVVKKGLLVSSNSYAALADADVIFICVPTPFNANKDPDISYIISAGQETAKVLKKGQLIILKSTTFPGTTEQYLIPELEKSGLKHGTDFFVAFSPERVDPGNKVYHTHNTPIVVGGTDAQSTFLASLANFKIISKIHTVSNPQIAELEKLLENIFRSVNIALVNELAILAERMKGIDIWEVIEAAGTKPFGFMKFTPGPGIGGHCIPIDPYYLSWLARKYDFETRFITLSANVNEGMPYFVANKVVQAIARQPVSLDNAKVLIIGVAFKKNVKDLRNSPAEAVISRLLESGVKDIEYTDPYVPAYKVKDKVYHAVPLTADKLKEANCVVIVTDHDEFDPEFIVQNSKVVVDTRNMTKSVTENRERISLLGSSL